MRLKPTYLLFLLLLCCCVDTVRNDHRAPNPRDTSYVLSDEGDTVAMSIYVYVQGQKFDADTSDRSSPMTLPNRPGFVYPATKEIRLDYISLARVLPSVIILGLHLDRQGFLWIAHSQGIIRFDGYDYVQLDEIGEFRPTSFGMTMHEDMNGDIWIPGEELMLFKEKSGVAYKLALEPLSQKNLENITQIHDDAAGNKLILRGDTVLYAFNNAALTLPPDTNFVSLDVTRPLMSKILRFPEEFGQVNDFIVGDSNEVWFVADHGIASLNLSTKVIDTTLHGNTMIRNDEFLSIHRGKSGELWLGGGVDKIARLDPRTRSVATFELPQIENTASSGTRMRILSPDHRGILWINASGAEGNVLYWFDPATGNFVRLREEIPGLHQTRSGLITGISDQHGNYWLHSMRELLKFNHDLNQFTFHQSNEDEGGLQGALVTALFGEADGAIWIGTSDGVLNKWDRNRHSYQHYKNIPSDPHSLPRGSIRDILRHSDGTLWVTTSRGLSRQNEDGTFRHYASDARDSTSLHSNDTYKLFEDSRNDLWVTMRAPWPTSTMQRYLPECDCFETRPGLANMWVMSIAEDDNGIFWLGLAGSWNGLYSYNPDSDETTVFDHRETQALLDIHYDHKGQLWEAWASQPLIKHDPSTGNYTKYDLYSMHPNNAIRSIVEDDDHRLWLGCSMGLIHFDPQAEKAINLYSSDIWMAPGTEWGAPRAACVTSDGLIAMGSTTGFLMFDPEQIVVNLHPPSTAITGIEVANQQWTTSGYHGLTKHNFSEPMMLNYKQNDLTFHYTALHFTDAQRNAFAYQLTGWDRDWIEAGIQRTAHYSNLSPGNYTFMIKAANSDGVWMRDSDAASIRVTIHPPWWATRWAYGLYILVIAGALWGFYRWRTRTQRQKLAEQMRLNKASTRFVPSAFLHALGRENILDVKLGDLVEREVTVLFSDIRDFTTISERMTPQENFQFVNDYSGRMGPVIQEYNGFVNQYLGDGIMAIFPENPADALKASIEMFRHLGHFNREQAQQSKPAIRVGMGLHSGSLIMGIVGDDKRLDAATISDTVNTASRIESLTKYFRVSTLLSEDTRSRIADKDAFNLRYLGKVQVKGKETPLDIYESFDADRPEQRMRKLNSKSLFEDGVAYFIEASFDRAQAAFAEVVAANPDDGAALHFLERSRHLTETGVPDSWTGVEEVMFK